jgi:hypothetical protein
MMFPNTPEMNEAFDSIPKMILDWYKEWYSRAWWMKPEYLSSVDKLKFDPRFFLKLALWHDRLHPEVDEKLFTKEWLPKWLWIDPYIKLDKLTFENFIQHKDKFWNLENYLMVWTNPNAPDTVYVSFSVSDAFSNETLENITTWDQIKEQAEILVTNWDDFWVTDITNAFENIPNVELYENGNLDSPIVLKSWKKISDVEDTTKNDIRDIY